MSRIRHNRSQRPDRENRPEDACRPGNEMRSPTRRSLDGYDDPDDLDAPMKMTRRLRRLRPVLLRYPRAARRAGRGRVRRRPGRRPGPLPPPDGRDPAADPREGTRARPAAGTPPQPVPPAALLCARVLARVLEKFEQIAAGQTPSTRTWTCTRPRNCGSAAHADHRPARTEPADAPQRCSTRRPRCSPPACATSSAARRSRGSGTASTGWRSAASWSPELSPRTELLERWTDELNDVADELKHLGQGARRAGGPADRAKQAKALREADDPRRHDRRTS